MKKTVLFASVCMFAFAFTSCFLSHKSHKDDEVEAVYEDEPINVDEYEIINPYEDDDEDDAPAVDENALEDKILGLISDALEKELGNMSDEPATQASPQATPQAQPKAAAQPKATPQAQPKATPQAQPAAGSQSIDKQLDQLDAMAFQLQRILQNINSNPNYVTQLQDQSKRIEDLMISISRQDAKMTPAQRKRFDKQMESIAMLYENFYK